MTTFNTITIPCTHEAPKIKGSRFVAVAIPVESRDQVALALTDVKARYPQANHYCFAWRLSSGTDNYHHSDDGEPRGTAGAPILARIDHYTLKNILVVVLRYFGGTKLGKGGLIRAYGGTAGALLKDTPMQPCEETRVLFITITYDLQGVVDGVLRRFDIAPSNTIFEETVQLEVCVQPQRHQELIDAITEVTAGRAITTT